MKRNIVSISTHAPLAGRDDKRSNNAERRDISTHAPLAGRDKKYHHLNKCQQISTHAPLAGRDVTVPPSVYHIHISTHAPLAGRDSNHRCKELADQDFNPRAPCGARHPKDHGEQSQQAFQPTRPLRGATAGWCNGSISCSISTHAPLAGRDVGVFAIVVNINKFQPTRPLRGATSSYSLSFLHCYDFNPRAPCGARQQKCTNHYAHFCDNRQISDAFAQNAACQGILLLFDAGKPCGFWVRTAQVISAHLCFAL